MAKPLFAQDLIRVKGGEFREVKLIDFAEEKFIYQPLLDSTSRNRVPAEVVDKFFTTNEVLLTKVRAFSPKMEQRLISQGEAQEYLGKSRPGNHTGSTPTNSTLGSSGASRIPIRAIYHSGSDSSIYGVLPLKGRDVYFTRTVSIPGASKSDLFHRARLWVSLSYRSAPNVIKYESAEHGTLIVKGLFYAKYGGKGGAKEPSVESTIYIRCKDGKVRIDQDGFTSDLFGNSRTGESALYNWARAFEDSPNEKPFYERVELESKLLLNSLEYDLKSNPDAW